MRSGTCESARPRGHGWYFTTRDDGTEYLSPTNKESVIETTPPFTLERAREVGTTVGVDWNACGFSVETFQEGMIAEYERALDSPDLDASDITACAQRARTHLFDFPAYYTQQDKLEAAYDEYYAERTD